MTTAEVLRWRISIPVAGMQWVVPMAFRQRLSKKYKVTLNHLLWHYWRLLKMHFCFWLHMTSDCFDASGCFPNARSDEPVFCSYNFDFNCIPSVKIAHCKQLLHSLDKDQRNSFSECNIIFLVYIYVYLLLYCRLFTKILAVLSSLKYMDDIILWIFLFKCYSVRFTVRQFVYNLFPYFLYNKLC